MEQFLVQIFALLKFSEVPSPPPPPPPFSKSCVHYCQEGKGFKLKQGIFVGLEIRKLVRGEIFKAKLTSNDLAEWKSFALVVQNYLGKYKAPNHQEIVAKMLQAYKELGARTSL